MKVVINAFSARRGGGQTYLINLLQHLEGCNASKIYILCPDSLQLPNNPIVIRVRVNWPTENPILRTLWEKFCLRGLLKKLEADILFCPGGLINIVPPKGCKTVITFQNMIPFDPVQRAKYPFGLMWIRNCILAKALLKSMIKADLVIFISDFARRVLEDKIGNRLKNRVTIPHGLNKNFKNLTNSVLPRLAWLPKNNYLLYVSTFDVYRNQLQVVQGFSLFKQRRKGAEKLVLVGHNSSTYGKKVRHEVNQLGLQNEVIFAGNIPYKDLPNVYYYAKLNIFASECENCPNILLESLAAGRPIVASNYPPMPEFGRDAVVYFDPSSPKDLADKLVSIIDNPEYAEDLSRKAKKHSLRYDWRETAHLTWNAIENLNKVR